jgi:RNA polymerase sigma-70 factor (ECF subfamily)
MDGVNPTLPNAAQAASAVAADLRKTARLLVLGKEAKPLARPRPRADLGESPASDPVVTVAAATQEEIPEEVRAEPQLRAAANDSDAHDKALMVRIAAGDERALGDLIEKHQGAVYGTIAKMLGDPIEAQDLAQQVFLRVYRAAGSYRATAQFKTWIFTIVRNLVFNEHRRRSRATLISLSPVDNDQSHSGHSGGMDLPDSGRTPGEDLLQAEMLRKIDEAILALPEQQRLAIVLRRYDEFSYEEIAEILKTSVPATKSLLFRARETLRLALKDYLERET